jgi:hypothetical protein
VVYFDPVPNWYVLGCPLRISDQIIHWDTFFWTKARFFLAVEGVALLATVDRFSSILVANGSLNPSLFCLLLGMVLLNWFLCFVWLLTGLRNRHFIRFRIARALEIEDDSVLRIQEKGISRPLVRLFNLQRNRLNDPQLKGKIVHHWEIGIPIVFAIAWAAILAYGIWMLQGVWWHALLASLTAITLVTIFMVIADRSFKKRFPPEV